MYSLIILALLAVALAVLMFLDKRSVKNMTYDKLLEKCKKLIDEGKMDKVQGTLMHHPKILLLHFNELQTALTDYAREVDSRNANND